MTHQIAYAIADKLPAEILSGDTIHAPAAGPAQHEPERIILAIGPARVVIPNNYSLDALGELGGDLIRLADEAAPAEEPAADVKPKRTKRAEG